MSKTLIELSIESLKKRQEKDGYFDVYWGEGEIHKAICKFNPPVTFEELEKLESKTDWILPEDYKNFLMIANGCKLFDDPKYGGENDLYKLEELIDFNYEDPYEECYSIAYIYGENIVINSKKYQEGNPNYLYVKDKIDQFEEAVPLGMNFESWFDRFVVCQGQKFWNWK
ncbi:SMI1/KNR4 family protein [Brevibacillus formosus]|uniref:SMI1/KNR4 family protein n=1 Tax=Brevibacillus formosus TaxID=54913 RepID=UPI003F1E219F